VPPRDNRIHSVHDRSGGGRRHRDDCRRGRDVFPMLPVAVTVRSYLVFQMAEVAAPTRAVRLHPRPDRTAASAGPGSIAEARRVQWRPAGGRSAPGVRSWGAHVKPECPRQGPRSPWRAVERVLSLARGRKPLPSRSRGQYPGSATGMGPVHRGNVRLRQQTARSMSARRQSSPTGRGGTINKEADHRGVYQPRIVRRPRAGGARRRAASACASAIIAAVRARAWACSPSAASAEASGARRGAADRLCAAPCGQASTFTLPSGRATHIKIHPSALSPDPNPSSISILTSPSSSLVTQVPQRP